MSEQSIQDNNQQILNDIQSLQTIEQNLFNSLENTNLTTEEQESIINKINRISEMRITLYKTLSGVNTIFQTALTNSRGTLQEQTSAIGVIEDELNQAKKRLRLLEEDKNNKIRLVEINNYYSQKYEEHTKLMKIVIFILIPIIILAIVNKTGILPYTLHYILVSLIVIIGSFFFLKCIVSIMSRDDMNYQEYNWYFDKKSAPKESSLSTNKDPWLGASIGSCIGQNCCSDGQMYDTGLNQCITSVVNDALTKGASINAKPDVTLSSDNVEPFFSFGKY